MGYGDDLHTYLVMGVNGEVWPYNASSCRFLKHGSGGQNPDANTPYDFSNDDWIDEIMVDMHDGRNDADNEVMI